MIIDKTFHFPKYQCFYKKIEFSKKKITKKHKSKVYMFKDVRVATHRMSDEHDVITINNQ